MTAVKICGIKSAAQARCALDAGADHLGFILYKPVRRYVEPAAVRDIVAECRSARPEGWSAVGVFVNEPLDELNAIVAECGLDLAQLCGEEDRDYAMSVACPVIRVVRVPRSDHHETMPAPDTLGATRLLIETALPGHYGGTGTTFDWAGLGDAASEAFVAGGLNPTNVAQAIRVARPWGVDVSSGVERDNVKDPELIRAFINEVRKTDALL
jgi:phosphoribosylanthranilate isomerase